MLNNKYKYLSVVLISVSISMLIAILVKVPSIGIGAEIISQWSSYTGLRSLDDIVVLSKQIISLTLFLMVVGFTILSERMRYYIAFAGIAITAFLGVVPVSKLLGSIEWNLVLFLTGSMTFAYVLRHMNVFKYLAIKIVELSKGSFIRLFLLITALAWFLAMVVDEVTSVVYIMMLLFELRRLIKHDIEPLIVACVLATNTGSLALPVGNPIGIYMAFTAGLTVREFVVYALPLSLITLFITQVSLIISFNKYLRKLSEKYDTGKTQTFITRFYTEMNRVSKIGLYLGLVLLIAFLATIANIDPLSEILTRIFEVEIDPHAALSIVPFLFIVISAIVYGPEKLEEAILKGVEWPSILFFISLFMLGYSLLYTGVASKLAYTSVMIGGANANSMGMVLLFMSAMLSSVLDNLSVIVAMTPIASIVSSLLGTRKVYWSLLYGGVLGGNFTPIGSTANIVAIGMAERRGMKVSWKRWFSIAMLPAVFQVIAACIYNYLFVA
ncbi:MAG: SLC13 family permease [Desulfurococcaceae archaeon]